MRVSALLLHADCSKHQKPRVSCPNGYIDCHARIRTSCFTSLLQSLGFGTVDDEALYNNFRGFVAFSMTKQFVLESQLPTRAVNAYTELSQ